jgi:hypothetical protein
LQAQPAPWLKLVNLTSITWVTPFPSQSGKCYIGSVEVEILTYAPTEFYHCQHCEVVWHSVGFGQRIRAEQRQSGLPEDLQAEYEAISEWVGEVNAQYGERVRFTVTDVASIEGVIKAIRYRARKFPTFVVAGSERIIGFDRQRLDAALAQRLGSEDRDGEVPGRLWITRSP